MRFSPRNKLPTAADRAEQMRRRRADSSTLRELSPQTALVSVHLDFVASSEPTPAAQSFVLYPAARAFFEYPCPYGDCDGVYDFSAQAKRALANGKKGVTGTAECTGQRPGDASRKQPCGLHVTYSISVDGAPETLTA